MNRHVHCFSLLLLLFFALTASFAQTAPGQETGAIAGRVFNPATNEYVRNADVSVEGTQLSASSGVGGQFRLANVPAGEARLIVQYTGYAPVVSNVRVVSGETVTHLVELRSSAAGSGTDEDGTVRMQAFVVESEKEGNAKALQIQRNSMTMSRSISSDSFGDVTEGNVGEFLKYLPGVDLEYVEADTRGPRLGGMPSEYTSVTMDGMKLASADAFTQYVAFENSAAGSSNRSFGFEQVSINSIESIEINRVTSAAMDADAPAGNIDLKTKRAFDSKGRRIGFNLGAVLNTEEFHFNESIGPGDSEGHKFRPNYGFNYSDVFFGERLGILVGVSESNLYNEQYRIDHTWNKTPTVADARPLVLTQVLLKDGPKWTERFTTTFTADFRATDNLTLSLGLVYNGYDARFYNRQVTLQAAANNTGATGRQTVGGDGVLSFSTTNAGAVGSRQVIFGGGNGVKLTNSFSVIPKFEYEWKDLVIDGAFAYSHSKNDYDNIARGTVANTPVANISGVGFTAVRSGPDEADWQITQTGGADWADLRNATNPRISDDNRRAFNDVYSGEVNARYTTPFKLPTFIQVGGKVREFEYGATNSNPYEVYSFVGPGGGATGSFVNYPSAFSLFEDNQVGVKFTSLRGGGAPAFPNRDALGHLFHTNPEYFVRNESVVSPAAYEQGKYTNDRDLAETVSAGYVMANTRWKKWVFQGGLRYEQTDIEANEWDPRTNAEILAAGYTLGTNGSPNTWAGMDYKYNSKPKTTRKGTYDDLFPSFTAKYSLTRNLLADFGWGRGIKRPNIGLLSGVWSFNDEDLIISASNPNLRPERSERFVGALSYYFGQNGTNTVQLVASDTTIRDLQSEQVYTAEEFGVTDPEYSQYEFRSWNNLGAPVTFRSLELSYVQYLTFLPQVLRGTWINASYTRTYASERRPGVVPHSIKGGIGYRYKRFTVGLNAVWRDEAPWFQGRNDRVSKANVKFDITGSVRLTQNISLYLQGRNIFEDPHRIMEESPGNPNVLFRYENYGSNWSFGVRGNF